MFILTHSVNFPCGRKPEHPEKTHDFRQSVDWLFSHESVARIEPTNWEVKVACSDDYATDTRNRNAWPNSFISVIRIVHIVRIWRSQTLPIWKAAGNDNKDTIVFHILHNTLTSLCALIRLLPWSASICKAGSYFSPGTKKFEKIICF